MSDLFSVNLVRLFDFYLAMMLVLGIWRRYPVYWNTFRILIAVRGRWPKLLERMRQNHNILLTTQALRPLGLAIGLITIQFSLSRWLFPEARMNLAQLNDYPVAFVVLGLAVAPMFLVDAYFLIRVGSFDRYEAEKHMDYAESWLRGWKGSAVRLASFGYVNPNRVVELELRKSLTSLSQTVSRAAWWVSVQITCRTICGATIWLIWVSLVKNNS